MKLEAFIRKHLYILTTVGIGIAFLQVKHKPPSKNPSSCVLLLRAAYLVVESHASGFPSHQTSTLCWPT